jgi:hypothetical protein
MERGGGPMLLSSLLGLMFFLVVGTIFGLLGGVLGAAMFRKDQPPAQSEPPAPTI